MSTPILAKFINGQFDAGFFEPTVAIRMRQTGPVVQDETLGPVITVQSFATEEEVITMANDERHALASSVWTQGHARALRASRHLAYMAVWLNTHILFPAEMPHVGFTSLGYGRNPLMYGVEDHTGDAPAERELRRTV